MKRWVVLTICAGLFGLAGCDLIKTGNTPESVGKAYITEKLKGIHCDPAGLTYTVAALDEQTAEVTIFGTVQVEETVALVKKDGQWVLAAPAGTAAVAQKRP